jgi:putative hydrolase of the HAD superfamily
VLSLCKSVAQSFWSEPIRHREGRLNLAWIRRTIVTETLKQIGILDDELAVRIAYVYNQIHTVAIHPIPGTIEPVEEIANAELSSL